MNKQAYFRFYEELNDFLPRNKHKVEFTHTFIDKTTIKDMIESLGVPHTEIDLILVNGNSVTFDYHVQDQDRISVYPEFESFDVTPVQKLRSKALRDPKFILDVHLGKLARLMRMFGIDTLYRNDFKDDELISLSVNEKRVIITRDIELLKRNIVDRGYWLRNENPIDQIVEVIIRFDLQNKLKDFSRCISCNGLLVVIEKQFVLNQLPDKVKNLYNEFYVCSECKKIYWKGTHFTDMQKTVEQIKSRIKTGFKK